MSRRKAPVATDRSPLVADAAVVLGAAAVAAPVGWMLYSSLFVRHQVPLPDAVDGDRRSFHSARAGRLSYYADERGTGRPVVLIHSVNAAASAFEMRPLFQRLAGTRPVYALELPGFGYSERGDRHYAPELYAAAITDFLSGELGEEGACDLVALSLGCEFAARAALMRPRQVRSLTFISPTGLGSSAAKRGGGSDAALGAISVRAWAQPLFDLIASHPSIEYFLARSFAGSVDQGLAEYSWRSAHQPGARFAPFAFLTGRLFTPNAVEQLYALVPQPVLVLYDKDGYTDFAHLPDLVQQAPNWRAERIPGTRGLPHFERPELTMASLERFWSDAGAPGEPSVDAASAGGAPRPN